MPSRTKESELVDYPWWKSRKEIKKFLETTSGWGLGLPHHLTEIKLKKLYDRHRPKEFVAFDVLTEIFDHPNCPLSIIRDGLQSCLNFRREADSCLNALALRKDLSVEELEELAVDFLGEDISDHALGALVRKNIYDPDRKCVAVLKRIDAMLPRPKSRDLFLKRWLQAQLYPKKLKKTGTGKKTKKSSMRTRKKSG